MNIQVQGLGKTTSKKAENKIQVNNSRLIPTFEEVKSVEPWRAVGEKRDDTPSKNPELRKYLISIFQMVGTNSITVPVASEMITLEYKRTFYGCIKDHVQSDIETLNYMDKILFDNLKSIFSFLITYAIKNRQLVNSETDKFADIRFVIDRLITTTTEVVDYDTGFDYNRFREDIDEFFYVFFG